ncbi:MAG: V-type ATP synthase subunit E [Bacillota bacterium]|nr:V-type ATP synthase subunit E [Bacillota bacterium]
MTTIDDKLELFNKLIFEKIYTEKKVEIDKFNKEKEEYLKKEKEKQEEKRNDFISDMNKKAAIKKNEIIAKEEIGIQQKLLVLKRELLKETMSALQDRIREFAGTEDYKDFLFKLIEQSGSILEDKNYFLYLTEQDKEKYGDEIKKELSYKVNGNIEIKSSGLDILGGLIIEEAEGSYRINNTLLSKLDDTREYAGLLLTDLLG